MRRDFIPQMEPWFDGRELRAVSNYMRSGGWVTEFKQTQRLERELAKFIGSKYCILTNNGTVSLILALLAVGIRPGDEVIVPNMTMIATANAAKLLGAEPVLVDIEEETRCLDLRLARQAVSKKTKALIYVPLNGRSGDPEKIRRFCRRHQLWFIEDAAQALGSYWQERHLGTFGDVGSFSLSTQKIITTGQGGFLITNSDDFAHKIRRLKDFGRARGGIDLHDSVGYNFKFTDIQAVIGLEQLKKLPWRIRRKREIWRLYEKLLSPLKPVKLLQTDTSQTTPWFIDIFVADPDSLLEFLKQKGVGARRVYPAVNSQKCYRAEGRFPVSKKHGQQGLWLPSGPELTNKEIKYVCEVIKSLYT